MNNEVNNEEGESTDNQTDTSIEDSVFSFFDFTSITGGSHVLNAANDDENDGNDTTNENDSSENILDDAREFIGTSATTRGGFNFLRDSGIVANIIGGKD